VIMLPRSDCAISFSGDADLAYPIIHQLECAIRSHPPLQRRSMDLKEFLPHAVKIINGIYATMVAEVAVLKNKPPNLRLGIGGYSWVEKSFFIWLIRYNAQAKRFKAYRPSKLWLDRVNGDIAAKHKKSENWIELGQVLFHGNMGDVGKRRLKAMLSKKSFLSDQLRGTGQLDMEPFEVIRDMLRDPLKDRTIGGAPQLVKIYQYMDSTPLGVYWPDRKANRITLLGRPILAYENFDHWILDPDTLHSSHLKHSPKLP